MSVADFPVTPRRISDTVPNVDFHTTTHEGQSFRFADIGEGEPVVLLHGFPDGPESWSDTARRLADSGSRAIVPFLRGYHPDTIVPGRGYGREEIGSDVVSLLDALDLDSAILVGHDWGASAAWSALSMAPERVHGIGAIAIPHPAAVRPSPKLVWEIRHFWNIKAPGSDRRVARGRLSYIETLYSRWAPRWSGAERDETVARAIALMSDPLVLHHVLEWYRDLSFAPSPTNNFRVACPGFLVAGSNDFTGVLDACRASVDRFDSEVSLLVVDGAGHWPHREGSDEFHAGLLDFVGAARRD